jgi:hypothetical protein
MLWKPIYSILMKIALESIWLWYNYEFQVLVQEVAKGIEKHLLFVCSWNFGNV